MPLSCLLFSAQEEAVQPLWPVLAELQIEAEHCEDARDAIDKLTAQRFPLVIMNWEDQPEAAILLRAAREQKAAQRPLILAIVGDESRVPEALKAGANSVLLKPLRPEQFGDTIKTACELLRAKQKTAAVQADSRAALGASAGASSKSTPANPFAADPAHTTAPTASKGFHASGVKSRNGQDFRAGEFLQSLNPVPGAQFDTESDIQNSLDKVAASEVDALSELEPIASTVSEKQGDARDPRSGQDALTGWVALQARLTQPAQSTADNSNAGEFLAYGETPRYGMAAAADGSSETPSIKPHQAFAIQRTANQTAPQQPAAPGNDSRSDFQESSPESSLEFSETTPTTNRSGVILLATMAAGLLVLVAIPRTREGLKSAYRSAAVAGIGWLNPKPAAVPQTVTQHDSFGQAGDEYKLPVAESIPDATTDPSKIRIVPVVDPTAKPVKHAEAGGAAAQDSAADNSSNDSNGTTSSESQPAADGHVAVPSNVSARNPADGTAVPVSLPAAQAQSVSSQNIQPQPSKAGAPSLHTAVMPQSSAATKNGAIPSSLQSEIASMTPDASGAKPMEAAMSSIEPVALPETAAWMLLTEKVDPDYPAAAKASGQKGSVVLQVLIARDGSVQEAKFMQGSLIFAKAAIDAVKQWHFKPYLMNGRAVSVQSAITLNFKPTP